MFEEDLEVFFNEFATTATLENGTEIILLHFRSANIYPELGFFCQYL